MKQSNVINILWISAIIAAFVAVFVLGWNVFYGWLVPKTQAIAQLSLFGVVGFSFLAGVISFFAPCPFSVFPSYVGYFLATDKNNHHTPLKSATIFATRASFGILIFYVILGLVLSYFGTQLAIWVNYIRIFVIVIIFLLGLILIFEKQLPTSLLDKLSNWFGLKSRGSGESKGSFFYGVMYAVAGAACFLPILLVISLTPILSGRFLTGLASFVAYGAAIAATLTVATVLVAVGKQKILAPIVKHSATVKKFSGILLIVTAIYLALFYGLTGM